MEAKIALAINSQVSNIWSPSTMAYHCWPWVTLSMIAIRCPHLPFSTLS